MDVIKQIRKQDPQGKGRPNPFKEKINNWISSIREHKAFGPLSRILMIVIGIIAFKFNTDLWSFIIEIDHLTSISIYSFGSFVKAGVGYLLAGLLGLVLSGLCLFGIGLMIYWLCCIGEWIFTGEIK